MISLTITGWVLSVLTVLFLTKSAFDKIRGSQEMVGNFSYMKLEKYRVLIGVAELLGAVLLLIPATALYGVFLISCFMSAAVALHLSLMGGDKKEFPIIVGVATILGYVLRNLL